MVFSAEYWDAARDVRPQWGRGTMIVKRFKLRLYCIHA